MINLDDLIEILSYRDAQAIHRGSQWLGIELLPSVAPCAYKHVLFPPIDAGKVDQALFALDLEVPKSYREMLEQINGAILFLGRLSLYGVRGEISRNPDLRKPFDVNEANTIRRPQFLSPDHFVVGGCREDGSKFTMLPDGCVRRMLEGQREAIAAWDSLEDMLNSNVASLERAWQSGRVKH